jgi:hypothetical protein
MKMLTVKVLRIVDTLWKSSSMNEIPGAVIELDKGLEVTLARFSDTPPQNTYDKKARPLTNPSNIFFLPSG